MNKPGATLIRTIHATGTPSRPNCEVSKCSQALYVIFSRYFGSISGLVGFTLKLFGIQWEMTPFDKTLKEHN